MAKPIDRVFHITITVFAMTLTSLSVLTLVYQHNPQLIRTWLREFEVSKSLVSGHAFSTTTSGLHSLPIPTFNKRASNQSVQSTTGNSNLSSTIPHDVGNLSEYVTVQGTGSDVPASQISMVEQLLGKYQVVDTVARTLHMSSQQTVHIYLAQTNADYKNKLATLGLSLSDASRLSQDTGGFTQGDVIIIPLVQNKETPDLVNTLAHEVTHVFLNHYVSDIPSWINEGIAVYNGMHMQSRAENSVVYNGYARRVTESVLAASSSQKLVPLAGNEAAVLQGNQSYDIELQDWLAITWLVQQQGLEKVHTYLSLLKAGVDSTQAFSDTFGMSETDFNQHITQLLSTAANAPDPGVDLQVSVKGGFTGYLRILQHGTQTWAGVRLRPGTSNLTVTPQGTMEGPGATTDTTQDSNAPDANTLYINLDPTQSLTYQGQAVTDCGFAIDYHDGLYAFINNWITLQDGKTIFSRTPVLFGVTLTSVAEHPSTNAIISLLS
ncbi:MAG: hypothetical protein A2201_09965 [Alicyclobacillus sp. RIFOXYA1_FULL_53_8]|nr:MAG: hypothetical protein A2201_09965 [Alicyclobacillus sp. RIFOXYA1_FULL_53_8]